MDNLLTCKLCNHKAKQLTQHIKSKHKITCTQYREMFGEHEVMAIGFNPIKKEIDEKFSNMVKTGYSKKKHEIESISEIYTKEETYNILISNDLYKKYIGKTKYRTLINDDMKLYKSIMEYTDYIPTQYFIHPFTFTRRLKLIAEYNYNIENAMCQCKRRVTLTKYCRICQGTKTSGIPNPHLPETILKLRISTLKYIETLHGRVCPRYNKKSIPIIEHYGKQHGYNFQHAENGGEFQVLGYFVDAYDPIANVVLEIDERHHFNINGELKEKDLKRQTEIENYLNCKFIRIKFNEFNT